MPKNSFSNFDFMDDDPVDPLIGGDGHLDGIKVHAQSHGDSISIELESSFKFISVFNIVVCNY